MGCNADTGGSRSDYFNVSPFNSTSYHSGVLGFRQRLQKAVSSDVYNGIAKIHDSWTYNCLYQSSATNKHAVAKNGSGDIVQLGDIIYQTMIFVPAGSKSFTLEFNTGVNCSVMVHLKFIDTQDKNKVWHITSFDDTSMAEDVLDNDTILIVDTTAIQRKEYNDIDLAGKEGYFIIQWAEASDVQASATKNKEDYSFQVGYKLDIEVDKATEWLNKSRCRLEPSYSGGDDPYLIPTVQNQPIFDPNTTRCDQLVEKSGTDWRYPCSIVGEKRNDEFSRTVKLRIDYVHDMEFTTSFDIEVVEYDTGIVIPSGDVVTGSYDATNHYVEAINLTADTKYKFNFSFHNNESGTTLTLNHSYVVSTVEEDIAVVPNMLAEPQRENTPDRITIIFDELPGAVAYTLNVNGAFYENIMVGYGTNGKRRTVDVDGLVVGTLYDFELRVSTLEDDYVAGPRKTITQMKYGWMDDPDITLSSTFDSITVDYLPVTNADTYSIYVDGENVYKGSYNTSHTINGLNPNQEYKVEVRAIDDGAVYFTSSTIEYIKCKFKLYYLDKASLVITRGAENGDFKRVYNFSLAEPVENATRYVLYINYTAYDFDGVSFDKSLLYGFEYSFIVAAFNDHYSISSDSIETFLTAYPDDEIIEPAEEMMIGYGGDESTNSVFIHTRFSAGREGDMLIVELFDESDTSLERYEYIVPDNTSTVHKIATESLPKGINIIAKAWFSKAFVDSVPLVRVFRTYQNDNGGRADNHPTNPDLSNLNTTWGYGNGIS